MNQRQKVVSSVLPKVDQLDLTWFFGAGQVAFERSPIGDQLRRAEVFTFGTMLCRACKGEGYTESPEATIRRVISGIEDYQRAHAEQIAAGKMPRLPDWYTDHDRTIRPGADGSCKECLGSGWVPRNRRFPRAGALTARPNKANEVRLLAEPNTDALERYGAVSNRLSKLTRRTAAALVGFFGVGPRWADDKQFGQVHGILSLTPAGKTLLKRSRKRTKNEDRLPDDVVLATEIELEGIQAQPKRRDLINGACLKGALLVAAAEAEWMQRADVDERLRRKPATPPRPMVQRVERIRVAELRLENVRRVRELVDVVRAAS